MLNGSDLSNMYAENTRAVQLVAAVLVIFIIYKVVQSKKKEGNINFIGTDGAGAAFMAERTDGGAVSNTLSTPYNMTGIIQTCRLVANQEIDKRLGVAAGSLKTRGSVNAEGLATSSYNPTLTSMVGLGYNDNQDGLREGLRELSNENNFYSKGAAQLIPNQVLVNTNGTVASALNGGA